MKRCYKFYCSCEKIKLINRKIMLERVNQRNIATKKVGKLLLN